MTIRDISPTTSGPKLRGSRSKGDTKEEFQKEHGGNIDPYSVCPADSPHSCGAGASFAFTQHHLSKNLKPLVISEYTSLHTCCYWM